MSRAQLTIFTNICMIEDLEKQRVVMQYRSAESKSIIWLYFPVEDICRKTERLLQSWVIAKYTRVFNDSNPQLVGIKNWP